jgi:hypothetical protein
MNNIFYSLAFLLSLTFLYIGVYGDVPVLTHSGLSLMTLFYLTFVGVNIAKHGKKETTDGNKTITFRGLLLLYIGFAVLIVIPVLFILYFRLKPMPS